MEDGILRAIDVEGCIRAVMVTTTNLVEEARIRHKLSYTAAAALGRALTGVALVAPVVAKRGTVSMKFQGGGPLGKVIADASSAKGTVRGYVENPQVELPLNSLGNFDIGAAVGKTGYLHVSVDNGFGFLQTSTVELVSGEIGEDISRYLVSCHDTGSIVIVGIRVSRRGVEAAGGLLVQLLPDHTEETICKLENNLAAFGSITFLMGRGMNVEQILNRALNGFELRKLAEPQPLSFDCLCSVERFEQALQVLDRDDLMAMADKGEEAEGRCQFCNAVYHVANDRLKHIAGS